MVAKLLCFWLCLAAVAQADAWQRVYGTEEWCFETVEDLPKYAVALSDGGVLIALCQTGDPTGYSKEEQDFRSTTYDDPRRNPATPIQVPTGGIALLKVNGDGSVAWYRAPYPEGAWVAGKGHTGLDFKVRAIAPAGDGGCLVAGGKDDPRNPLRLLPWVLRYDKAGKLLWEGAYRDMGERGMITSIAETRVGVQAAVWGNKLLILRLDPASGRPLAMKTVQSTRNTQAELFAPDGSLYVIANVKRGGENTEDMLVARHDPDGKLLWEKKFGGKGQNLAQGYSPMMITADGGVVFGGMSTGFGPKQVIYGARLGPDGSVAWEKTFGMAGKNVWGHDAIQVKDGGCVLYGHVDMGDRRDLLAVKVDAQENKAWEKVYAGFGGNAFPVPAPDGGFTMPIYVNGSHGSVSGDVLILRCEADGSTAAAARRGAWKFKRPF